MTSDTALYRRYVYHTEPPFALPIEAFGGIDDPNVSLPHLTAWQEQTTARFHAEQFPGGHFYLQDRHFQAAVVLFRSNYP